MWHVKAFNELDLVTLEEIYRLRVSVFVVEQESAYQEIDGKDMLSTHIYRQADDGITAYLRIVHEASVSIGRVIVRKDVRGTGTGTALMRQAMNYVDTYYPATLIYLHGQAHLEKYYQSFGFKTVSDVHLEDGIPHLHMEYKNDD